MSADKKERMKMRVLFSERIVKEVFASQFSSFYPMTPKEIDEEADKVIDTVYRLADKFIERQQKVVDEYQLAEQPRVVPGIIAPPNMQRG